jgi:nitrogen fixation/metabolism regulation signal transduction histidine kinase
VKIASELLRRRKDNRLIVGLVLAVLVVWAAVSVLEQRAAEMDPATITRGLVIFVLSYINVTLIAAVLFVLGRTLIKLWLDRKRPALGSRFQTKLLVTYIGLTAIPVALVFFTATGLLQNSIDRWFSTPVRQVVQQARAVQDRAERRILDQALQEARALAADPAAGAAPGPAGSLEAYRAAHGLDSVEVYSGGRRVSVASAEPAPPPLPPSTLRGDGADREPFKIEVLADGSHRYRAAFVDRDRAHAAGIRIPASESRTLDALAAAWSDYQKLEVQKPAIKAANISTFLLITLAILFASIWTGLTLARRITGPIGALAASTGRLRSGDFSARVDVPATDELAVLVESFNRMAAGLEDARGALVRSNEELQVSNRRLDLERLLFSTVLESVTTGVVAFDADGFITVCNPAARSLLSLDAEVTAASFAARGDLAPLVDLLEEARSGAPSSTPREFVLEGPDGERHLEASIRPLSPAVGRERGGWVLAVEDTTHVAREQKLAAWNEVARRVAHEIKNPLTPIRLSAERILRRFRSGEPDLSETIERGAAVIVEEVGFLKSLVNEFSRFARLPPMRREPTDLEDLARSAVRLFEGEREGVAVRVESFLDRDRVLIDPDQIKRVLVNLIDNALEACGDSGEIVVRLTDREGCCTIEVADTGRGVPARDRDKLFLPDFTTKGRGTGLGLAIVYRIVMDHRGTIRVEDNRPRGARFIIELPAA